MLDRFTEDLAANRLTDCGHVNNYPQPVFVALAFPDKLFCAKCAMTKMRALDETLERAAVCDTCNKSGVTVFSEVTMPVGAVAHKRNYNEW